MPRNLQAIVVAIVIILEWSFNDVWVMGEIPILTILAAIVTSTDIVVYDEEGVLLLNAEQLMMAG